MAARAHDVATLAGVSQRTVSNVVRGYVHVRPETRDRVQRAIDELRYRPNPNARSLRASKTGIIGLAVPNIASPYFAELADHVQRVATTHDLTLLIDQTGNSRERELLVLAGYRAHVIDGLIFSPMAITAEDLAGQQLDMPLVLLGERIRNGSADSVAIDNLAAGIAATRHLLDSGRSRLAAIGANLTNNNVAAAIGRLEGYHIAHAQRGVEAATGLVIQTEAWDRSAGYSAVDALVRGGQPFDALFCFNDLLAAGAVRALTDHGLQVPTDVSLVGWDDIEESAFSTPSLTSVSPDKAAIAEIAVTRLLRQIGGEPAVGEEVLCSYDLVVRESTRRTLGSAGEDAGRSNTRRKRD